MSALAVLILKTYKLRNALTITEHWSCSGWAKEQFPQNQD